MSNILQRVPYDCLTRAKAEVQLALIRAQHRLHLTSVSISPPNLVATRRISRAVDFVFEEIIGDSKDDLSAGNYILHFRNCHRI